MEKYEFWSVMYWILTFKKMKDEKRLTATQVAAGVFFWGYVLIFVGLFFNIYY